MPDHLNPHSDFSISDLVEEKLKFHPVELHCQQAQLPTLAR